VWSDRKLITYNCTYAGAAQVPAGGPDGDCIGSSGQTGKAITSFLDEFGGCMDGTDVGLGY